MEDSQTEEVLTDDLMFQAIADNIATTYQIEPADGASTFVHAHPGRRRPLPPPLTVRIYAPEISDLSLCLSLSLTHTHTH